MKKNTSKGQFTYDYNEHDENQVERLFKQRHRIHLRKKARRLLVLIAIAIVVVILASPISRVSKIEVNGLNYLTQEAVIKESGIKVGSFRLFATKNRITKHLKQAPMVSDVVIKKHLFGTIEFNVVESPIVAYYQTEKSVVVIDDKGLRIELPLEKKEQMQSCICLYNFTDEKLLDEFCQSFVTIAPSIRQLISDVHYAPIEVYDEQRIQFDMNDGKKVYLRLPDMASEMKYYSEILSHEPNACSYDMYGNKAYAKSCD